MNVKINRRNLCSAGQPTDIKIKVSNPAVKGLNKEYIVHVNRGASPPKTKKEKAKKQKSSRKKSNSKDDWFDSLDSCEDEDFEDSSEETEEEPQNEEAKESKDENENKTEEIKENIPENNNLKMLIIKISCALAAALATAAYFIIKKRKNSKK